MFSSRKQGGSGAGGGGKKPPGNPKSSSGKSGSTSKGSSKGTKREVEQETSGDPEHATVRRRTENPDILRAARPPRASTPRPLPNALPSADPGPSTVQRRTGSQEMLKATMPIRIGTPRPMSNALAGMEQRMKELADPKLKAANEKIRDEIGDINRRSPEMTKSILAVGRVDDTNRSLEAQPMASAGRQFLPPNDPKDLRLHPANPSAGFGPSGERGPLFGNNENFVLVTEYLLYWEDINDVGQVCHDICFTMDRCFGNQWKHYALQDVYAQLGKLMETGLLPRLQIRVPGWYDQKELDYLIGVHHRYKTLPPGQRYQKIAEVIHHQPANQPAYDHDGKVLYPPLPEDHNEKFRDVKFFNRYLQTYAFQHWPSSLRAKIWEAYLTQEQGGTGARRYHSDERLFDKLDENRERFHIEDKLAVSAFLWSKFRPTVSGAGEKEKAMAGTRYFFSKHPLPVARHIAFEL